MKSDARNLGLPNFLEVLGFQNWWTAKWGGRLVLIPEIFAASWNWLLWGWKHLGPPWKFQSPAPRPIGLFGPQKGKKTSRHDFFRGYLLRLRGLMPHYVWTLLMLKQDRRYINNPSKITLVDSGWRGSLEIILLVFGRLAKNPIIFRTSAIIESSASRDGFLAEGSWELTNDQPLLVNSQSRGPYEVSMAIWKLGNPEKNEQRFFQRWNQ